MELNSTVRILSQAYSARIKEVNGELHAVNVVSPVAFDEAARLDEERADGKIRSILHGLPLLVKVSPWNILI